jgi:hypothetical protein
VSVDAVLTALQQSLETTKKLLVELVPALPDTTKSPAHGALATAVLTDRSRISPAKRAELAWLLS